MVRDNQSVLTSGALPVLLLHGEPGAVVGEPQLAWVREHAPGVTIRSVGPGTHFLPEDQPEAIADAVAAFLSAVG